MFVLNVYYFDETTQQLFLFAYRLNNCGENRISPPPMKHP
jgi:hypothetical protein